MLIRVDPRSYIRINHIILIVLFFGIGLSIGVTIAVGILLYYQVTSVFCSSMYKRKLKYLKFCQLFHNCSNLSFICSALFVVDGKSGSWHFYIRFSLLESKLKFANKIMHVIVISMQVFRIHGRAIAGKITVSYCK